MIDPMLVPTSLPKRMLADGSYEALPQSEPVDTDYFAPYKVQAWDKIPDTAKYRTYGC